MFPTQNRPPGGGSPMAGGPTPPMAGPGGPPPGPGGPGGPPRKRPVVIPPHVQQHVDRNNPLQAELLQRIDALSPQDIQAFATGISPQAVAVLKKVLPELGFLLDRIGKGGAGGPPAPGGAPPMLPPGGGATGAPPPSPPMMAGPGPAMPRPQTKLSNF